MELLLRHQNQGCPRQWHCLSLPLILHLFTFWLLFLYFSALLRENSPSSLSSNVKIGGRELWHNPVECPLLGLILWPVMWEGYDWSS